MRKDNVLKQSLLLGGIIIGSATLPLTVKAVGGNGDYSSSNEGIAADTYYDAYSQIEKAYFAAGITDMNLAGDIFTIVDSSGEPITKDKLDSIAQTGGTVNIKLEYSDSSLGKKMADVFGEDTYAIQHFINQTGSGSSGSLEKNVNTLVSLKKEISGLQSQIKFSNGGSFSDIKVGPDGKIEIVGGGDFTSTDLSGNSKVMKKLGPLLEEWERLTGSKMPNTLSPEQINIVLGKLGENEDATLVLTPRTKNFYSLNRVVIEIKDASGKPVNANPNQGRTAQLMKQYSGDVLNKYKKITGKNCPTLVKKGPGKYEMNFINDIKKQPDYLTKMLKSGYLYGSKDFNGFMPAAAFTIGPSSENIKISLSIYGDLYEYKEKIATGIYPTGRNGKTNMNDAAIAENKYYWKEYSNSYYYSNRPKGVSSDGSITDPYYDTKSDKVVYTSDMVKAINKKYKKVKYDTTALGKPKYKLIVDASQKYKFKANEYYNGNGNQPLYSKDDGKNVRNILFKKQQIRYWDFMEKPLSDSDAYKENYVLSKYRQTSYYKNRDKDTHLANFKNDKDRVYGDVKTTTTSVKMRLPNTKKGERYKSNVHLRTHEWTLAPLSGVIEVPAKSQVGDVNGVISDADVNIR